MLFWMYIKLGRRRETRRNLKFRVFPIRLLVLNLWTWIKDPTFPNQLVSITHSMKHGSPFINRQQHFSLHLESLDESSFLWFSNRVDMKGYPFRKRRNKQRLSIKVYPLFFDKFFLTDKNFIFWRSQRKNQFTSQILCRKS